MQTACASCKPLAQRMWRIRAGRGARWLITRHGPKLAARRLTIGRISKWASPDFSHGNFLGCMFQRCTIQGCTLDAITIANSESSFRSIKACRSPIRRSNGCCARSPMTTCRRLFRRRQMTGLVRLHATAAEHNSFDAGHIKHIGQTPGQRHILTVLRTHAHMRQRRRLADLR